MYNSILARSFSKHEQKKLGYGALVCSLLIVFCFCTLSKPFLSPLPACESCKNFELSCILNMMIYPHKCTSVFTYVAWGFVQ